MNDDVDFYTEGQIETCSKKVRGRAQRSLDLIQAMYEIAKATQPITGRGIGYKLFTSCWIPSKEPSSRVAPGDSRDGSSLDDLAPLNGIDVLGEADPLNVGFG